MPDLYDLFWIYPLPQDRGDLQVQLKQGGGHANVINNDLGIPAVILYPSLLTPEILVRGKDLQIILGFRSGDVAKMTPARVAAQLKISAEFSSSKTYRHRQLDYDQIRILPGKTQYYHYEKPIKTATLNNDAPQFTGMLDERIWHLYRSKGGFDCYCTVFVPWDAMDMVYREFREDYPSRAQNKSKGDRVIPPDPSSHPENSFNQDRIVHDAIKVQHIPDFHDGQYGFEVGYYDVSVGEVDLDNPVQTFHPVFVYDEGDLSQLKIGHMSDIHLNSRQQLLRLSDEKIIKQNDIPEIGTLVNVASRNTKELLDYFGNNVDIITIGGDIVDFIENAWCKDMIPPQPAHPPAHGPATAADCVRSFVKLDESYTDRYKPTVDFLTLYSLIVNFYKSDNKKPIFLVTGNHDCYLEPVGMYPTLGKDPSWHRKKTDEFIPASHNLTLYEAILAFGKSYHRIVKRKHGHVDSAFDPAHFAWIHSVFTPFSDFRVQLPNHNLVGLSWGGQEDISNPRSNYGIGYLPIANNAVSNPALGLIKEATQDEGRKTILLSHFSFVSYDNDISDVRRRATIDLVDGGCFQMGTFMTNTQEVWNHILAKSDRIACILTGHTHRRAAYLVAKKSIVEATTTLFPIPDPEAGQAVDDRQRTELQNKLINPDENDSIWVIVSDSGGSLPRRNRANEFGEGGIGQPSGLVIGFDQNGKVTRIEAKPIGPKPRIAVALDYYAYISRERHLLGEIRSEGFKNDNDLGSKQFTFVNGWKPGDFQRIGLIIESITLRFTNITRNPDSIEFQAITKDLYQSFFLDPSCCQLALLMAKKSDRSVSLFVDVALTRNADNHTLSHYDFTDHWIYELKVRKEKDQIIMEPDKYYNLEPDFDKRGIVD